MKKMLRKWIVMLLAVLMLTTTAAPAMAASLDMGSFENFESEFAEMQAEVEKEMEEVREEQEEREREFAQKRKEREEQQARREALITVLIVVLVLLLIAEIAYIFFAAPKCGMSRFWALVPLFSNLIGLLVFIIVRTNYKSTSNTHTITCPTCSSVHPLGTDVCSICGTALH